MEVKEFMKKRTFLFLILAVLFAMSYSAVLGQDSPFSLKLTRDWGYGNGADINGRMSLAVKGDLENIQEVIFFLDNETLATVTESPFKVQFDTNTFDPGLHTLTAEVKTKTGETYTTSGLVANFLDKNTANQSTLKTMLLVGGIILASLAVQLLMRKNADKNPKVDENGQIQYGVFGGAVCPNCGQPFSRSFFGINLLAMRLERCPHCGKLVQARRATPSQLTSAQLQSRPESAALSQARSKAEEIKDSYDDSKYTDL